MVTDSLAVPFDVRRVSRASQPQHSSADVMLMRFRAEAESQVCDGADVGIRGLDVHESETVLANPNVEETVDAPESREFTLTLSQSWRSDVTGEAESDRLDAGGLTLPELRGFFDVVTRVQLRMRAAGIAV